MAVNLTGAPIKALTNVYWLARKSRLPETQLGRKIFAASYFAYKRYLEDPYYPLVRRHPELFLGGNNRFERPFEGMRVPGLGVYQKGYLLA